MKNVLIIAYHFPPVRVSSGIQRTLKFSQYLLENGWRSLVLTVNPRAYETTGNDQLSEIPKDVLVVRAQAWDTAKHLAFKGRYFGWMALPDRWASWCLFGSLTGLKLIYTQRPRIIYSTYPIATAHLLGLILQRLTRLPWVADFRDSMTEEGYPTDPVKRKAYLWIEKNTIQYCRRAIFTTSGAIKMYSERYPEFKDKYTLISNGYDEENFVRAEQSEQLRQLLTEKKTTQCVLLHSGILYPHERDPSHFFQALSTLKQQGEISAASFKVILRATGHDALYQPLLKEYAIDDLVFLMPNLPYETALAEMLAVDGLLVFQASNCNHQIPAKIYEYLRAQKPILALTDPIGDTADVLRTNGVTHIVRLDDAAEIQEKLPQFLRQLHDNTIPLPNKLSVFSHSRQAKSALLAGLFDKILTES